MTKSSNGRKMRKTLEKQRKAAAAAGFGAEIKDFQVNGLNQQPAEQQNINPAQLTAEQLFSNFQLAVEHFGCNRDSCPYAAWSQGTNGQDGAHAVLANQVLTRLKQRDEFMAGAMQMAGLKAKRKAKED